MPFYSLMDKETGKFNDFGAASPGFKFRSMKLMAFSISDWLDQSAVECERHVAYLGMDQKQVEAMEAS